MTLHDLLAGVYQHYKGPLYQAIGYGHDANAEGRVTVHYIGLELEAHSGLRLSTRTAVSDDAEVDAWWDFVHDDGSKCLHGHEHRSSGSLIEPTSHCYDNKAIKPRFKYIGPGRIPVY
jgi:hypothetical protein